MALLTFPFPVADGTVYPVSPPAGTNIYRWDGTDQTWRLLGPASGVAAGTYGTPLSVPQITVDATGRITVAIDVPIQLGDTTQVGLVQLVDDLISNDPTKALTAAQGFVLSNEIGDTSLLNPFYPNLVTAINTLGAPSGVTAGTYGNSTNVGRFTVNAQGRITSATNVPLALATTISPGVVRVGANLSVTPTGVLSVPNSSTTTRGAVQLVNDTVTNDNTKALTAAAGYDLQLQIDALEARNNLTFAGTIDGATGLMLTVTAQGTALGFAVANPLPAPSLTNNEYFVVVTVPGTFTPTGGAPQACNDGDWFVSDGSQWLYYNVGPTVAAATFIQLDDISGQFNNTRVAFTLRVSGAPYTPPSASAILLSVGGVIQVPGNSFTLSGSTVTFSEAPRTGTTFVGYAVSGLTGGGGGGGGGSGTVTSVGTGTGLLGGPITTTGTISLRPATNSTLGGVQPDNTTISVSPTGVISVIGSGAGNLQTVTDNGSVTTRSITVGGLASTGTTTLGDASSDLVYFLGRVATSFLPNVTETYDLGSPTQRWRDLYVSSNSIYMGTNQLTVSGGQLLLNGSVVGGGGGSVAAPNTGIQFNNNGVFGASPDLTWDGTKLYANSAETRSLVVSDGKNASNGGLLFGTSGGLNPETVIYNFYPNREFKIFTAGAGSPITFRNAASSTPLMARLLPDGAAELYHNGFKKLETTSTGISATGNVKATAGQLQVSNTGQPTFVTGFQAPDIFTQSVIYKLPSADGSAGQVLSTNGSGALSWVAAGSATAAGSNTQVQFNNNGVLGASSSLTWNGSTLSVPSISFNGQIYSSYGSGYFYVGQNPAALSGSSVGTAMGYGALGFQRYSTSSSDVVLIASYQPTLKDTVLLTVGGDFYLRDLFGNDEFTVTGAGNVYAKGTLAVDSTISTNGEFHLNSSQFRIIGASPGAGDVTLGNISGPGGLVVRCGQSRTITFTNENGLSTFASISGTGATVPSLTAAGLRYPTTDGTSGQVLTTNGAGVLSWASGSGAVSTLQQVTTAGNTTTNTIRLFDSGTSSEAITLDPLNGQISVLPQAIGEPGFYISPTAVFFGNSSGDVRAGGTFPATLQFNGSLGTNIKTVSSTIPVQLWAGGLGGVATPQLSVTGTATSISNQLQFSNPTQTATWAFIQATSTSLNLGIAPNTTVLNLTTPTTTITNNLQMAGYIQVNSPNGIRFYESSAADYVGLSAPSSLGASYNLTLPPADGTADQVLATDGTGDLQWLTTAKIVAVPASSSSGGAAGQIAFGNGFFYWFNTATNQWLRVAGNTF